MLTKEQSNNLEKLQSAALKIIYSYKDSYGDLLQKSGLDTLFDRRPSLLDKFVVKTTRNQRFEDERQ